MLEAVAGVVVLLLVGGFGAWGVCERRKGNAARALLGECDDQIKRLLEANERLRSPLEGADERRKSAAAELATRGLRADGTPAAD